MGILIKQILLSKGLDLLVKGGAAIMGKLKSALGLKPDAKDEDVASALEKMDPEQFKKILDLEYYLKLEEEATKRLEIDNNAADSWLTKHIRPLSLITITVFYLLYTLGVSIFINNVEGTDQISLIQSFNQNLFVLLTTITSFYFGGRSYEKAASIKNSR